MKPRRSIEVVRLDQRGRFPFRSRNDGFGGIHGTQGPRSVTCSRSRMSKGQASQSALAQVIEAEPDVVRRPLGFPVHAFVEAHIEQGPILEREGISIGVVTGIQGSRRFRVTVSGEAAHAGTTPRGERKDAVLAAAGMIDALGPAYRRSGGCHVHRRYGPGATERPFGRSPGSLLLDRPSASGQ